MAQSPSNDIIQAFALILSPDVNILLLMVIAGAIGFIGALCAIAAIGIATNALPKRDHHQKINANNIAPSPKSP